MSRIPTAEQDQVDGHGDELKIEQKIVGNIREKMRIGDH